LTNEQLTAVLAERVMGWTVGPDRFMMGNRGWMPRWRFQPAEKLDDAFRLLEQAAPQEYSICGDDKGGLEVRVRVGVRTGTATGGVMATAIATAVARAVGLQVPDEPSPTLSASGGTDHRPRRRPNGK